ncbi:Cof-type HAD-IIB family hydrolase [Mesomycoplasma molare]|uniref:Cof-type HAD-IIB family hydrolase n=1 Tax=Mesomycoplasma molare TaxID=171288 RepID=A0ABY5TXY8_9BACT|nr:Cof-type HAD-IIB family hydrolase [Mesomycoplasma molare]UWD34103.1 Cof-type HAD-IIB family hydrolase [Mesomycoplasma molare]
MKTPIKKPNLLFLDLDGTLLDKGIGVWARMSEKNKNAVLKYSKDHPVVISTGRVFSNEVRNIALNINAEFVVCQNGSIILDKNFKELENSKISSDVVEIILKEVQDLKITFVANPGEIIYGRGVWNRVFSWFSHFEPKKYSDFFSKELNKILLISRSKKKIKKILNLLNTKFSNEVEAKVVGKNFAIEITKKGCSKGNAAKKIADLLNIDLSNSMHIGDSMNDSSTKNIVGNLIALKSGSKRLREIADTVGPRKRRGGVAKILNSFK